MRFIEDAGNLSQSFGIGRVVGQIYALLYFSPEPRNLGDMQEALGISKGSASTCVRQLETWGAVRRVWIKGDRKDYYEANDWFGRILKNVIVDMVGSKISAYTSLLEEAESYLTELQKQNGEAEFIRNRVAHLRRFHERTQRLWTSPLLQRLLK